MKKRIYSLLALILMVCLLVSCTQGATTTTSGSGTTTKTTTGSGTTATTTKPQEDVTMKLYLPGLLENTPNTEVWNRFIEMTKQQTGVVVDLELYDWGDNRNQRLNMYAASGDLPSGVWLFPEPVKDTFIATTMNSMGEAGMLHTWDQYVDDPQLPNLKNNPTENFLKMMRAPDGNLYMFPTSIHFEFPHAPGGIALRQDWLDQLGLSYPETEDDLYDIIKAFKEQITDVNGNPVIPVSLCGFEDPVQIYVLRYFLSPWIGHTHWYINDDGTADYAIWGNIEGMKAGLWFLNKLWQEDLFDKEAFSQKPEQFTEKCINGQIGVKGFSYALTYNINSALMEGDPDALFVNIPPKTFNPNVPQSEVVACQIPAVPMRCVVVTKDGISDELMATYAKMINWVGEYDNNIILTMGFEDEYWELNAENKVVYTDKYKEIQLMPTQDRPKDGLGLIGILSTHKEVQSAILQQLGYLPDRKLSIENIQGYQKAMHLPIEIVTPGPIELEKTPLLEQAFTQMLIAAISAPSEAAFNAVFDQWVIDRDALGYQELRSERLEIANALSN